MNVIHYRAGYKYQLAKTYVVQTRIRPAVEINVLFIRLTTAGELTIQATYAWDGPSGPTIDTPNFMRASLIHDALYQLMRMRLLDVGWRETADEELKAVFLQDSKKVKRPWGLGWTKYLSPIRAWWIYRGVRFGGEGSAEWQEEKILTAP